VFRIAVENNVVRYYQNNILRYISLVAPTLPLLVDVSIFSQGGTVTNALVANLNAGTFTATATNAGPSPTYQWILNGVNVGTNSATYTNTSLVNNDQITCLLTPDFGGCATTTFTSNIITTRPVTNSTSIDFYITGTTSPTACNYAEEQVRWKTSDLLNTQATGNNLLKIQSNGVWNGGAASWNTVDNNGYFQFTATETNRARRVGLSSTNTNADWPSIQYAIHLRAGGIWEVNQSGGGALFTGAYVANDVFRIAVENNVVRYYQNNILINRITYLIY
jgi:hypothetical protein